MQPSLLELPDEFASGNATRPRRWAARLSARLFAPPYLPGPLIGFTALAYVLVVVYHLSLQPPEFWIKWANPYRYPLFGGLLESGVWWYLAANLVYLLAVTALLAALNRKVAFPAWMLLMLLYFSLISSQFSCGYRAFFLAQPENTCHTVAAGFTVLISMVWGAAIAGAILWIWRSPEAAPETAPLAMDLPEAALEAIELPQAVDLPLAVDLPQANPPAPGLFRAARGAVIALAALFAAVMLINIASPRPQWRKLTPAQSAPDRYGFGLAYDTQRQRAVMFGGGSHVRLSDQKWYGENDTWEWDGSTWAQVSSSTAPPPRLFAGMAYDEKRGVTVLFGGAHLGVDYDDTWEWDGQAWTQRTPAHNPGPHERFQLVYDTQLKQVIFYGGLAVGVASDSGCDTWYTDAWTWDGADWSRLAMDSDLKICCYSAAYHPQIGATLIFNADGLRVWHGDRFDMPTPVIMPKGSGQGAMTYDPRHGVAISFGGDEPDTNEETWQFDGAAWKQIYTKETPPGRQGHALFYDAVRQRVILFGGFGHEAQKNINDTWELVLP